MATSTPAESDVSSTTVQVASLGGQTIFQPVGSKQAQQYLIVNPALHTSGGRIQIVTQDRQEEALDAVRRREILARQPSYCKILNDLKEAESSESEDCHEQGDNTRERQGGQKEEVGQDLVMKGEAIEVVDGGQTTQTVVINGQQYQIMSPGSMDGLMVGQVTQPNTQPSPQPVSTVQYTTSTNTGHGTVFIPAGTQQQVVTVQGATNGAGQAEEQARKREIRLMKNREAARECRNKKKEYIKCLENRVAVLENQNKALIEELKSLKELYTGQKN